MNHNEELAFLNHKYSEMQKNNPCISSSEGKILGLKEKGFYNLIRGLEFPIPPQGIE
jgi:predicted DNA-binding transcriptional regulator AlpA